MVPAPKKESPVIRLATYDDAEIFYDHTFRHMSESGNNDLIFHPVEDMATWNRDENVALLRTRWAADTSSKWERAWAVISDGNHWISNH